LPESFAKRQGPPYERRLHPPSGFPVSDAVSLSTEADPNAVLARLRVDIDRIDAEMHRLLMERGEIIDTLIAVKARQGGGSAFRPGREAEMMRRIAGRHGGLLPLDTVEGIWRIIISTFTYVQAHYSVHADISAGDAAMRDSVRFHFGFTVPFEAHQGPTGVIDAVARSGGDLGMVRLDGGVAAGAWWRRLAPPDAPKIIARVPFIERPDHPAGMPVFVLSLPLAEAAATDVLLYSLTLERWRDAIPSELGALGCEIVGNAAADAGLSLLVAAPGAVTAEDICAVLGRAGCHGPRAVLVGSHAARYDHSAPVRV
jgi:chorismate mutase